MVTTIVLLASVVVNSGTNQPRQLQMATMNLLMAFVVRLIST